MMLKLLKNYVRSSRRRLPGRWLAPAVAIVLFSAASAQACPMCKTALGSGGDHFINAWGASIVFMLSMPFVLMGSFSLYMYYLVRRAREEQAAKEAAARAEPSAAERADQEHETIGV